MVVIRNVGFRTAVELVDMAYELLSPETGTHWRTYHAIRREVLWEARGRNDYDDSHPDEHNPTNFPKLLFHDGVAIGVIRIDLHGETAWFRRVAIRERLQRQGHGRILLELAEDFAKREGVGRIESSVDEEAIPFYRSCGYKSHQGQPHTSMFKLLS